jgi:FlgD Ig-like domain
MRTALVIGLTMLFATPASAAVTVYTSLASFHAAAPSAALATDFEFLSSGPVGNFSVGGLTISSPLGDLYIISPTVPGATVPLPTSNMLTGNGDEDIDIAINSGTARAFGFVLLNNNSGPHTLTLYDVHGTAFFTHHPTQANNTVGFLAVVSDTIIGRANWTSALGELQNTALDSLFVGSSVADVPGEESSRIEPAIAWPNPFRERVSITFAAPSAAPARLEVFDLSGRRVWISAPAVLSAGQSTLTWNGRDENGAAAPAGLYFLRVATAAGITARRVVLTR